MSITRGFAPEKSTVLLWMPEAAAVVPSNGVGGNSLLLGVISGRSIVGLGVVGGWKKSGGGASPLLSEPSKEFIRGRLLLMPLNLLSKSRSGLLKSVDDDPILTPD